MKTKTKAVMWAFVAVPFVIALVFAGMGGQKTQAKYELGPVAWSELSMISGGITEHPYGCGEHDVNCGTGPSVYYVKCDRCNQGRWSSVSDNWSWTYPEDGFEHIEFAGTGEFVALKQDYNNVHGLGLPDGKYSDTIQWINCGRNVFCTEDYREDPGQCSVIISGNGCVVSPDDSEKCIKYKTPTIASPWIKVAKGNCVDP